VDVAINLPQPVLGLGELRLPAVEIPEHYTKLNLYMVIMVT